MRKNMVELNNLREGQPLCAVFENFIDAAVFFLKIILISLIDEQHCFFCCSFFSVFYVNDQTEDISTQTEHIIFPFLQSILAYWNKDQW